MQPSRPEGTSATVRDEEEIYRLAQVVRSTRDAVLSKDLDGVITSWNPGAVRLYGYSEEEAIGSPISLLIPADRKNEEREILDRACRGEAIETYETERIRKDGVRIDVSLTISPIEHPQRGIVGASVIARDITAESRRRRAQEFLVAATRGLDASLDFDRTARTIVRDRGSRAGRALRARLHPPRRLGRRQRRRRRRPGRRRGAGGDPQAHPARSALRPPGRPGAAGGPADGLARPHRARACSRTSSRARSTGS